jgi:hypothetical protein
MYLLITKDSNNDESVKIELSDTRSVGTTSSDSEQETTDTKSPIDKDDKMIFLIYFFMIFYD